MWLTCPLTDREKAFDKVNTEKRDIFCCFDLRRQQIRFVMADASLIQKSRLGLVDIPDDISFPDLILQRATEYGNRTALVSMTVILRPDVV